MNYKVYQDDDLKQTVVIDSKFFIHRNLFRGYSTNNKIRVNKNNFYYYDYPFKDKGTRILLKPNTEYTVTWDYEVISGDTDNTEVISVGRGNEQYDFVIEGVNALVSDKKVTIQTPADISDNPYLALRFSRSSVPATSVIDYWDIAIREGNTDYVWTPAPEDLSIAVMNGLQPNQTYEFGVEPDNGQTGSVGANLIVRSELKNGWLDPSGNLTSCNTDFNSDNYIATNGETVFTFSSPDYEFKGSTHDRIIMYDSYKNYLGFQYLDSPTQTLNKANVAYIRFSINTVDEGNTTGSESDWLSSHRYKLEKGSVATRYIESTSVTTRGIRFNIPKTLTVDSTITLRYEEYPLGIVPIGNEPSGMFGGGNKQNLSANVISTANGSSVVEVAGNVIEVGNKNLWIRSKAVSGYLNSNGSGNISPPDAENLVSDFISVDGNQTYIYQTDVVTKETGNSGRTWDAYMFFNSNKDPLGSRNVKMSLGDTSGTPQHTEWVIKAPIGASFIRIGSGYLKNGTAKLEPGTIATPYASFVDGDTFTAQPDGTCALFSEHKALYY